MRCTRRSTCRVGAVSIFLLAAAGVLLLTGESEDAHARPVVVEQVLSPRAADARAALQSESWDEAASAIEQGLEAAQEAGETRWVAHFRFLEGLMHQSAAQGEFEDGGMDELVRAVRAYGVALEMEPENGTVLNNVAQVYADAAGVARANGDPDRATRLRARADELFEKAIEHAGPKQFQYKVNYGEILRAWGRWRECKVLYGELLMQNPDDAVVLEQVAKLYLQSRDRTGLMRHLWWLIGQGNAKRAQEVALRYLADPRALRWLSQEGQVELLTVVVTGLASQRYDPSGYAESDVARRLRSLVEGPLRGLRTPVRTIEALHTRNLPHEGELRWWSAQAFPPRPNGLTPVEAIQRLALQIGDWYRGKARAADRTSRGRRERERWSRMAQALYELPVRGRRSAPSPAALRRQAALWVDLDRKDELRALVQRPVTSASAAPSAGPAAARWQRQRFEVHRLLGKAARVVGGGMEPQAVERLVTTHLTASVDSAKQFNTVQRGIAVLKVSPSVIHGLETSLEKQGKTTEAVKARAQLATHYMTLGEKAAAKSVFQPLEARDVDTLPAPIQLEVKTLQRELQHVTPGMTWRMPVIQDPGTGPTVVGAQRRPARVVPIGRGVGELALFEPDRGAEAPQGFDYGALGKALAKMVAERMESGKRGRKGVIPADLPPISGGDLVRVEYRKGSGRALLRFTRARTELDVPFDVKLSGKRSLEDFVYLRKR